MKRFNIHLLAHSGPGGEDITSAVVARALETFCIDAELLPDRVLVRGDDAEISSHHPRVVAVEVESGEWVIGSSSITGKEGFRIAASVLPGVSEDEVERFYARAMSEDVLPDIQHLYVPFADEIRTGWMTRCGEFRVTSWSAQTQEESNAVPICTKCHRALSLSQETLLGEVRDAWMIAGPARWLHERAQRRLQRDWPRMADAIQKVVDWRKK